jgi:hypothetical protein
VRLSTDIKQTCTNFGFVDENTTNSTCTSFLVNGLEVRNINLARQIACLTDVRHPYIRSSCQAVHSDLSSYFVVRKLYVFNKATPPPPAPTSGSSASFRDPIALKTSATASLSTRTATGARRKAPSTVPRIPNASRRSTHFFVSKALSTPIQSRPRASGRSRGSRASSSRTTMLEPL